MYLGTSTEAAGVQEGEDVETERSGQQAGEVSGLQGEPPAHAEAQEHQLISGTFQHKVLQHRPPLTVRPPVKLTRKEGAGGERSAEKRSEVTSILCVSVSNVPTLSEGSASLQTPAGGERKGG